MVRGVRGATTVENNEATAIIERVKELLQKLIQENEIALDDIGAAIFSSTPDLDAAFPAVAARQLGWGLVPLFGTQEMDIEGGLPHCVRVLLLLNTELPAAAIRHVYLHGAMALRPDIN